MRGGQPRGQVRAALNCLTAQLSCEVGLDGVLVVVGVIHVPHVCGVHLEHKKIL